MVTKTKAAILVENHKPLVVADLELPKTLSFGQVVVKIAYSTICGAQINEIEAAKGPDKYLPHLLGHEASGKVINIGPNVKHVAVGDMVVLHWRKGAGIEAEPATYVWKGRIVNAGWVTTFQEYSVVSENRMTKVPDDSDMKILPLFGCAVTTAFGVVNNDAHVNVGQSVVVFGTGGVGMNIVQALEMVSAFPIVGIDIVPAKLKRAKKFGASHVFDGKTVSDDEIRSVVGADGADVVIDTTGAGRVIERCYNLTHPDGKTILVGVPKKGDNVSIYTLPLHFKKVLKGSHGGSTEPHIDIPRYLRLLKAEKFSLDGVITSTFPLDLINDAIAAVRSGQNGRVLLAMV